MKTCNLTDADLKIDGKSTRDRLNRLEASNLTDADLKIDGKSTRDRLNRLEVSVIVLNVASIFILLVIMFGK